MDNVTNDAAQLVLDALLNVQDRINITIENLPYLSVDQLHLDDSCPICLFSFQSILSHTEDPLSTDSSITKVPGCGHIFCRKDLCEWVRSQHGTCPTCRHSFANIHPPSESDDESSDGGEYIPPDDMDEDDEDALFDTDALTEDSEFEVDEMELEGVDFWSTVSTGELDADMGEGDIEEQDWGLTDGESMSSSNADVSVENEIDPDPSLDDNVSVQCENDEELSGEAFNHLNPPEEEK